MVLTTLSQESVTLRIDKILQKTLSIEKVASFSPRMPEFVTVPFKNDNIMAFE